MTELQKKVTDLGESLNRLMTDGDRNYFRVMEVRSQITSVQRELDQKRGLRKLTDNDGPDSAPRWSPDGKQLAWRVFGDFDKQQKLAVGVFDLEKHTARILYPYEPPGPGEGHARRPPGDGRHDRRGRHRGILDIAAPDAGTRHGEPCGSGNPTVCAPAAAGHSAVISRSAARDGRTVAMAFHRGRSVAGLGEPSHERA